MKIINIDGGIGRVITSLPSLLKYHKNNPEEEWYLAIPGWDFIPFGIPELHERTFNPESKGSWENYYLKADEVIHAEPYRLPNFYKGKISLAEAFDEIINKTEDHSDLEYETLSISNSEIRRGQEIILNAYESQGKEQTIVINPYGSTAQICPVGVYDDSLRSLPESMFIELSKLLAEDYNVIYMGYQHLLPQDDVEHLYVPQPDLHIRDWMGVISQVDYLVGCDSVGQHIARATGTQGCVIMGGTDKVNMSYPDHFRVFQKKKPVYSPMRISMTQSNFAERLNKDCMDYTEEEILDIYENIKNDLENIIKQEEC
jgi:ADP-heptose:LPS heptosyltransferase